MSSEIEGISESTDELTEKILNSMSEQERFQLKNLSTSNREFIKHLAVMDTAHIHEMTMHAAVSLIRVSMFVAMQQISNCKTIEEVHEVIKNFTPKTKEETEEKPQE